MGNVTVSEGNEYDRPVSFVRHNKCKTKLQPAEENGKIIAWCPDCRRDVAPRDAETVSFYNKAQQHIPTRNATDLGGVQQLGRKELTYEQRVKMNKW
jgi:hypothetical protein